MHTHTHTASSNVLTPCSDSCASVMGGKIYLMGGYSANYEKTLGGEVFDPATGKWTALPVSH